VSDFNFVKTDRILRAFWFRIYFAIFKNSLLTDGSSMNKKSLVPCSSFCYLFVMPCLPWCVAYFSVNESYGRVANFFVQIPCICTLYKGCCVSPWTGEWINSGGGVNGWMVAEIPSVIRAIVMDPLSNYLTHWLKYLAEMFHSSNCSPAYTAIWAVPPPPHHPQQRWTLGVNHTTLLWILLLNQPSGPLYVV
jgi:hypothetical protein